jgi:hypothetical protein
MLNQNIVCLAGATQCGIPAKAVIDKSTESNPMFLQVLSMHLLMMIWQTH